MVAWSALVLAWSLGGCLVGAGTRVGRRHEEEVSAPVAADLQEGQEALCLMRALERDHRSEHERRNIHNT